MAYGVGFKVAYTAMKSAGNGKVTCDTGQDLFTASLVPLPTSPYSYLRVRFNMVSMVMKSPRVKESLLVAENNNWSRP